MKRNIQALSAISLIGITAAIGALRAQETKAPAIAPDTKAYTRIIKRVVIMELNEHGNYQAIETLPVFEVGKTVLSKKKGARIAMIEEVKE